MTSCAPPQSLQTSVTWRRSNSVRNSAIRVASRQGEVGVAGHRRGVRAERQLRDDAAVTIPQAVGDGVPQGATYQHPVQQHHHRPVAARVGVHETGSRRPLQLHPDTPSPVVPSGLVASDHGLLGESARRHLGGLVSRGLW